MRGFTETPLERTIKDMQEMGLETTELELTLNNLAKISFKNLYFIILTLSSKNSF